MEANKQTREKAIEAMEKRGFRVIAVETKEEAREAALSLITPTESVGVGGSVSVRETGVLSELTQRGHTVFDHWACEKGQASSVQHSAMTADVYLCSCNAITQDGQLVYIDGNGNRVGAVSFGPKKLIIIASESKLVSGGISDAIARIKREACPLNARRLGLDTPCSNTGACRQSECPISMCHITLALTGVPGGRNVTVILAREKLGY